MRELGDKLPAGDWIKGVDARVKLVAITVFVVTVVTLTVKACLMVAALLLLLISLLAGISTGHLIKRLALIIPFGGAMVLVLPFVTPGEPLVTFHLGGITFIATKEGWEAALLPSLRMINAFLGMTFLTSTTPLRAIIHALNHLRFPKIFILLIDFTVRYITVIADELNRMQLARKARGFKAGWSLCNRHTITTLGSTIATLFFRSFARSERVYLAMLSRGYDGEYKCCGHCHGIKKLDWGFGSGIVLTSCLIKLADLGGCQWNLLLK